MADDKEGGDGNVEAQLNSREDYNITNLMDGYSTEYASASNFSAACGDSPKRPVPPRIMDCAPAADDSSDSLCRVDLPSDLIVASPMKISEILSLLLESPEKSTTSNHVAQEDVRLASETDLYANQAPTFLPSSIGTANLIKRSHSWQKEYDDESGISPHQCSNSVDAARSLPVLRRSKSLDDICGAQNEHVPTSLVSHSLLFPSISATNTGVDIIGDLIAEAANAEKQEATSPVVNILGFSLPLVSIDGDPTPYVCVTDVFQTFFSTRHWDEFKAILEKNGIRSISTVISSAGNTLGIPEVIDAIDVKEVESLLLSNQARKDGFVRCVRLSMENIASVSTNSQVPASPGSVMTESKIVMMPERQVGELSSGIKTRHGDQSDILYVELDGCTLPSIVLNGIQYVRLVDVQKKFFAAAIAEDKPQPTTPASAMLAKQLQVLKNACNSLRIDVLKCKPNEKARLVVYANSYHSNSLHIIAVEHLPRLIEHLRHGRNRGRKKYERRAVKRRSSNPSAAYLANDGRLRVSVAEQEASNAAWSPSTPDGSSQLSPSSGPDSVDSGESGTSSGYAIFTAPPSPALSGQNSVKLRIKRRASLNGPADVEVKKLRQAAFSSYSDDRDVANYGTDRLATTTGTTPMSIWQNGHLKTYACAGENSSVLSHPGHRNCASVNEESGNSVSGFECPDSSSTPVGEEVTFTVHSAYDFGLGRDEDNLIDVLTPKDAIAPCEIVVDSSTPLQVVVYNRRGCRGPAGKYYDHLFVNKYAPCIWCFGCDEFLDLRKFVRHIHSNSQNVPNPQLFMWVSNVRDAKFDLWRSLLTKARRFDLQDVVRYDLPENFNEHGATDGEISGKALENVTLLQSGRIVRQHSRGPTLRASLQHAIGGGPTPPPPPSLRRRQVRGDAYVDVMERFSTAGYQPPSPHVLGLYSTEHENAIDASYTN